jgi:hypothetical protein
LTHSKIDGLDKLIPNETKREFFSSYYLSELDNLRTYGYFVDDTVQVIISCYKSIMDTSWYLTHTFYNNIDLVPELLSYIINMFEGEGIYKFYNLVPKDSNAIDKLQWKLIDLERYIQVDECLLPAKTKSFHTSYWMILQERMLLDNDYIIRCNFLKPEYRSQLPLGGNI